MLDKTDGRILAGDWTENRVADLTRKWAEGLTATQIAADLGGVTRNAVLGKVHRLGISDTAPPDKVQITASRAKRLPGWKPIHWTPPMSREERLRRRREREALQKIAASQPSSLPSTPRPDFLNLTFDQLSYGDCRYPIGDDAPFVFCGRPTVSGTSWCLHCYGVTHKRGT